MSALRKEKSPATAESAGQNPPSAVSGRENVADETVVDPTARRPPQSATTPVTENTSDTDDTYDGEIVSSTVDPVAQPGQTQTAQPTPSRDMEHIFDQAALRDFRARWDQVQTSFVDEPRHAVEQADALVGAVVKRIADQFAEERAKLEKQWGSGQNVSTEELRQNFKRYRAFFDRLLAF